MTKYLIIMHTNSIGDVILATYQTLEESETSFRSWVDNLAHLFNTDVSLIKVTTGEPSIILNSSKYEDSSKK